jgi:hypothetical protein
MKKLGTLMAAAMIFAGTATFAATPVHTAKAKATTAHATVKPAATKATTVNAKQEPAKPAAATHAKKMHKKHHAKKAAK